MWASNHIPLGYTIGATRRSLFNRYNPVTYVHPLDMQLYHFVFSLRKQHALMVNDDVSKDSNSSSEEDKSYVPWAESVDTPIFMEKVSLSELASSLYWVVHSNRTGSPWLATATILTTFPTSTYRSKNQVVSGVQLPCARLPAPIDHRGSQFQGARDSPSSWPQRLHQY